jgi:mono/diheme cytochrome c family protein
MYKSLAMGTFVLALMTGNAVAQSAASSDYLHDCAECHGADGKGAQASKRAVPGYISVDLTQISKRNGGEFPRQKVYDAISGHNRIPAHFHGDMPRWGDRYSIDEAGNPQARERVEQRISGMVDYLKSIQEK